MTPEQAKNLSILIRHMETKVTRTLNMNSYHRCGTPACAIGEAACMPHFQALGLKLVRTSALQFRGIEGHGRASEELFGLSDGERDRIFGDWFADNAWNASEITPKQWAAEARKVLAENGYSMDDAKEWADEKVRAVTVLDAILSKDPSPAFDND